MEFMLIVVTIILFALTYAVVKLLTGGSSETAAHLDEIPGPKRLPVIGNLHLLGGRSPPHHVLRELGVRHGPLMRVQLGEVPFLVVSSVEAAKQVLRTHDVVFSNRIPMLAGATISYNYKDIAIAPADEHWRQLRRICTLELLSARRVRSFRRIREEENLNLARWIASNAGSPANLSDRLHLSSFNIIARSSVGITAQDSRSDRFGFGWATQETLKLASGFSIVDLFPSSRLLPLITGINFKIARIFRVTDRLLQSIIDQHVQAKAAAATDAETERTEDLVDVLLKYQEPHHEFQLTTDTIKAVILDMLFGGGDTSATALGWAMSELIRNPSTMKRAQEEVRRVLDPKGYVDEDKFEEMKFFKLVIKETLRLHPPVPLLVPRMSCQRCKINGYEIPAQTRLIINAWALGRDPKHWDEAEKFRPERFEEESSSIDFKGNNFEYMPFGSGRRICPGMAMGLLNVEFTLATLLYHFDWEMPFGLRNADLDMGELFGAAVKRKTDLLLIPTLRRSLP